MYVENDELGEDVDILTGDDSQRFPKMCIKYFRAYRTCSKYHQDIHNKLRKALETLDMVNNSLPQANPPAQQTPSAKRPRLVPFQYDSQQTQSQDAGKSSHSPDVAVSPLILLSMMMYNHAFLCRYPRRLYLLHGESTLAKLMTLF